MTAYKILVEYSEEKYWEKTFNQEDDMVDAVIRELTEERALYVTVELVKTEDKDE